jgi:hypothetical protein
VVAQNTYAGAQLFVQALRLLSLIINIKAFIRPLGAIIYRTRGQSAIYTAVKLYKAPINKIIKLINIRPEKPYI